MGTPSDQGLRAWQRFHLRITMLFATVVFTVITAAAVAAYAVASRQARDRLARQMEVVASTYAAGIPPRRCDGPRVISPIPSARNFTIGSLTPQDDHPARAVRCALAMRQLLARLNEEADQSGLSALWKQAGVAELAHRVGIHTGPAVAGNIGSATRMKYAVLGDTVNIAARLEQLNKEHGTQVLVSGATRERLPPELVDELEEVGSIQVKGRVEPVDVYRL